MKRLLSVSLITVMLLLCACPMALGAPDGVHVYFSPNVMQENGDIIVSVCIDNVAGTMSEYQGLCALNFSFTYDSEHFALKETEPLMNVNEFTLVKRASDIETRVDGSRVWVSFLDSTLDDSLLRQGGTLCYFTLTSLSPVKLWNSFDAYPLRFVPDSLGGVLYDTLTYSATEFEKLNGIDAMVGGYNEGTSIHWPSVGKTVGFAAGSDQMYVGETAVSMDAVPYFEGEQLMVPVRFLAEAAGMEVDWDGESEVASLYGPCQTCYIPVGEGRVFVNARSYQLAAASVCIDGRTYVPVSAAATLFGNGAGVTVQDGAAEIVLY